jgi:hypothetical protein
LGGADFGQDFGNVLFFVEEGDDDGKFWGG